MGDPIITEYDKAAEAITPGHLLGFDGSGNYVKHAAAATACARDFAMERDELGKGIDPSVTGTPGGSANYAIGDVVKVGSFSQGMHVNAWIASGQNITKGDLMESAGNGTLKEGTTAIIAIALESPGAVTVATRLRVKIV
jgi:hypothetical protein